MNQPPPPPPPKLLRSSPHDAPNPTEVSLTSAFCLLRHRLVPPFSLSIPSPSDYSLLTQALAFAVLTQPNPALHLTHLHSLVTDAYRLFADTLFSLAHHSFPNLLPTPQAHLLWAAAQLVRLAAPNADRLIISLLRWIKPADLSPSNFCLCKHLLTILSDNWDCLLDDPPLLTSALFVFLRVLSDHYRLSAGAQLDQLKRMEIAFCVKVIREHFGFCLHLGRDFLRLLQDLVSIPEFRDVWRDLLFDPSKFGVTGFTNVSQIYRTRTPNHYFLLRITPEIEAELRFLLTHVKWGSQKRYQAWFAKKHICDSVTETVIVDIVRFICCAHHPPDEIIRSNVISRWAVIGWLLKCCKKNYIEANVKLAMFYDWLFFDERVDNIMNIEPAILLMVHSLPQYADITHTLLEFLFLLVDNYDTQRKEIIVRGVSAAFGVLVKKGVLCSLEPLTTCSVLSPLLRERLATFAPNLIKGGVKISSNTSTPCTVPETEIARAC